MTASIYTPYGHIPPTLSTTTTVNPVSGSFTIGANTKAVVLMIFYAAATQRTGGAPDYSGGSMVQLESLAGVTEAVCEMWWIQNPSTSASWINIPNANTRTLWAAVVGINAAPGYTIDVDDTGITETTNSNPNVTVDTTVNNALTIACVATGDNTFSPTASRGTIIYTDDPAAYGSSCQYLSGSAIGTLVMTWTEATSDDYGAIGAAFKEILSLSTLVSGCPVQLQTADNVTLTAYGPMFSLTVQDANQTQNADNLIVSYHVPNFILTVQDSNQIQKTILFFSENFTGNPEELTGDWETHADFIAVKRDGSGGGYITALSGSGISIYTGGHFSPTQYAKMTLYSGATSDFAALVLRAEGVSSVSKFYSVHMSVPTGKVIFYYYDGSNFTPILEFGTAEGTKNGDVVSAEISGWVITFKINDKTIITYEDTSQYIANGYPGIYLYSSAVTIDDWEGGSDIPVWLEQHFSLIVQDSTQIHTSENTILSAHYSITTNNSTQYHEALAGFISSSIIDNFNRETLGSDWLDIDGTMSISSGSVISEDAEANAIRYNVDMIPYPVEYYMTVGDLTSTTNTVYFDYAYTISGYYRAWIDSLDDTQGQFQLHKYTLATGYVQIGVSWFTWSSRTSIKFGLRHTSAGIFHMYCDRGNGWEIVFSAKDTSRIAEGYVLLRTYKAGVAPHITLDDFGGGTIKELILEQRISLIVQNATQLQTSDTFPIIKTRVNGSRKLNGTTDKIYWENIATLTAHALTFSAWVYWDGSNSSEIEYIINLGTASNAPGAILHSWTNTGIPRALWFIRIGSTNLTRFTDGNAYPSSTWVHVLATHNGTFNDYTTVHIYLNGIEQTYSGEVNGATETALGGKWTVGSRYLDNNRTWNGKIAEVAVWDRVLSSEEIALLSNRSSLKSGAYIPNGLLFLVHPDEPKDLITGAPASLVGTSLTYGPDLDYPDYSLVVNNTTQIQTSENVILSAHYSLLINNSTQAQTSENVILSAHYSLLVNDSTQIQTSENVILSAHYSLLINDSTQTQTSENVILSAFYTLVVQDSTQTQTSESVILSAFYTLVVQDATQTQISENVPLSLGYSLVVNDATQAQTSENVILIAPYILTANNTTQLQTAGNIILDPLDMRVNGGRYFGGAGNRINWSSIYDLTNSPLTISAWARRDNVPYLNRYFFNISQSGDAAIAMQFYCYSGSIVYYQRGTGATSVWKAVRTPSIETWHHVLVTHDGVLNDYTHIHIYVNGVEYTTVYDFQNGSSVPNPTGSWTVGGRIFDNARDFFGNLGEVAVWNRVLSSEEITEISSASALKSAAYVPEGLLFLVHPDEPKDLITGALGTLVGTSLSYGPDLDFPDYGLTVQNATQIQVADNTLLSSYSVNNATQAQTSDNITIIYNPAIITLSVNNTSQGQLSDNITLKAYLGIIININNETGDISQYTSISGSATVTGNSGLAASGYGLEVFTLAQDGWGLKTLDVSNISGKIEARFYFDPNGMTASDNTIGTTLLSFADNIDVSYIAEVRWDKIDDEDYPGFVFLRCFKDGLPPLEETSKYAIIEGQNCIEVYLQRATTSISSDGSMSLYINGEHKETVTGIDNYDEFINLKHVRIGIDGGASNFSGTVYLDELIVRDDGIYIGPIGFVLNENSTQLQTSDNVDLTQHYALSINDSTQLQTSDNIDLTQHYVLSINDTIQLQTSTTIFSYKGIIGNFKHETGDFSEYQGVQTNGGNLTVTSDASLAGTAYGLSFTISDTDGEYAWSYTNPINQSGAIEVRVHIDPNTLSMSDTSDCIIAYAQTSDWNNIYIIYLRYTSGSYSIRIISYKDGGQVGTSNYIITDEPHCVEVKVLRATNNISSDGSLTLWIDEVLKETVSNIDNYDTFINTYYLAVGSGYNSGTVSGTYYVDEVVIRDDGHYIGPNIYTPTQDTTHAQTADNIVLSAHYAITIQDATHTQFSISLYTEDFEGTEGELAGNWTTHADFVGVRKNGSGEGYCNTNDADAISIYTGGTFANNQYTQCIINVDTADNVTLVLRATGTSATDKFYAVSPAYTGGDALYGLGIYYYNGTDWIILHLPTGSDLNPPVHVGDTVQAEIYGYIITFKVNGSQRYQIVDTNEYISSGKAGIGIYDNVITVDDWEGGSSAPIILLQHPLLTVQDAIQTQTSDNVILTAYAPAGELTIQDATQAQTSENVIIAHHYILRGNYLSKVGSFNIDTSKTPGQTQSITGVEFQPKIIFFWWGGSTGTGDTVSGGNICAGFGAAISSTNRFEICFASTDAVDTSDTMRNSRTDDIIRVYSAGNIANLDGEMDFSSMDADGFTLLVNNQFSNAYRITYLALGGTDITNVFIGNKQLPITTGVYNVTGVGFKPDAIITASTDQAVLDSSGGYGIFILGMATGASNQGVVSNYIENNSAISYSRGYGYNGEVISGLANKRNTFVSFNEDGFTLNNLEGITANYFLFVAIKGGQYKVGDLTTRTDGNDIVETIDFQPKAILFASVNRALSTQDVPTANDRLSIGAGTSSNNRACIAISDEDGLEITETAYANYDSAVYAHVKDDAIEALMDLKSIESDGFTCVMDNTETGECWVTYLAAGDKGVKDTTQLQTADNVILTAHYAIIVNNSTQVQTSDNVILTQNYSLFAQDAIQLQTSDNVTLTAYVPAGELTVQDATQAQTSENVVLTQNYNLSVQDSTQLQTADNVILTAHYAIIVNDSTQAQTSENINLIQHYILGINDAVQGQTSSNITLIYGGYYNLILNDSSQAQTSENITISHHYILRGNYLSKVGSFNIDTTKAVGQKQSITGVGFQPKIVFFWWGGGHNTGDEIAGGNISFGFGAAISSTNRYCILAISEDNVTPSNTNSTNNATSVISIYNSVSSYDGTMDFSSMDADGFSLEVDDQFTKDFRVSYLALGGTDLTNVYMNHTATPTATGNWSVNGVGFKPDALITFGTWQTTFPSGTVHIHFNLGFASGASNQGIAAIYVQDNVNPSNSIGYGYNGECAGRADYTREAFVSFDNDGFTLNQLEGTLALYFTYICLKGGQYSVGDITTRTDGNDIAETVGFEPKALLFASVNRALSIQNIPTDHGRITIGAATSASERACAAISDEDGLAVTETAFANYDSAVYAHVKDDAIEALMDLKSIESDGFTCVMDNTETGGCWVTYLAAGDKGVKDTTQAQTSDNITLIQNYLLTINNTIQLQTSENIILTQNYNLSVQDSIQTQTSENINLIQHYVLGINDTIQGLTSSNITLIYGGYYNLILDDSSQTQTSENIVLTQHYYYILTVNNTIHIHAAERASYQERLVAAIEQDTLATYPDAETQIGTSITFVNDKLTSASIMSGFYIDHFASTYDRDNVTSCSATEGIAGYLPNEYCEHLDYYVFIVCDEVNSANYSNIEYPSVEWHGSGSGIFTTNSKGYLAQKLGNVLGLPDLYSLNITAGSNLANGQAFPNDDYNPWVDHIMYSAISGSFTDWDREIIERENQNFPKVYNTWYDYQLADTEVHILNYAGNPLPSTPVEIYRNDGNEISATPAYSGTTDTYGYISCGSAILGDTRTDAVKVFLVKIVVNTISYYQWFSFMDVNFSYWDNSHIDITFESVGSVTPHNATQLQTADNISVTYVGVLNVNNATQVQTSENVALIQHHVLVIDNATQTQTSDNIILSALYTLVINNVTQAQTSDNITLTVYYTVISNNADQLQTSENVTLTQHHILALNNATQSQTSGNVELIAYMYGVLTIQNPIHIQTSENVVLTQHYVLPVNNVTQQQTSENITLLSHYAITVNNSTQVQISENIILFAHYNIVVENTTHILVSGNIVLSAIYGLYVNNAIQAQTSENINLIQHYVLTINNTVHTQITDGINLIQHYILAINNATQIITSDEVWLTSHAYGLLVVPNVIHLQLADNINLTQHHILAINNSAQLQTAGNVSVVGHYILGIVNNAVQQQTAENISLTAIYGITTHDSTHVQTSDNISLTQHHILAIQNAIQLQTADNISVVGRYILGTVNNTIHLQTAESLILTAYYNIVNNNSVHVQTAENVDLIQHHILAIDNCTHIQTADNIDISAIYTITVNNCTHLQTAENVILTAYIPIFVLGINDSVHILTSDYIIFLHAYLVISDAVQEHTANKISLIVQSPTPYFRIYTILHENRDYIIRAEERDYTIEYERRYYIVPTD